MRQLLLATALLAPSAAAQPAANARPCVDAPEYRRFDFWIGDWDVSSAVKPSQGPPALSRIELIEDGCVIFETYRTAGGYSGRSLNSYHPDKQHWEQFWTDNKGAIHHYVGRFQGGKLVYEADGVRATSPSSPPAKARMTFFDQGRDQVRQLGEQSTDGGKTWTTTYDLVYRRRAPDDAAVRAVATGIVEADNARDVERVLGYYADDAVLLPPNEPPVKGKAAIRPRYEALFAGFDPAIEGRLDEVAVTGPSAFVRGHNGGRMTERGSGEHRPLDDDYVMLLRKGADGAWRISHLIWH
jgi:uncharacterized protein (TIGR02246 family)